MAAFGEFLLRGTGGPKDNTLGLVTLTQAAELGSDLGAYYLGWAFFKGKYSLPKDPAQARFWLKRIADGECKFKQLGEMGYELAAGWLRELNE